MLAPITAEEAAELKALISELLAIARVQERERCVEACKDAMPPAHTYASENADIYRAGDRARDVCIAAIRALGEDERVERRRKDRDKK